MHRGKDLTEVRNEHKETRAGHVGLEQHEPTSLRGIAIRAKESMKILLDAKASTAEEPDAGKLHVRDWAAKDGTGLVEKKVRDQPLGDRKGWIDAKGPLPLARQCELAGIARSTVYAPRRAAEPDPPRSWPC